MKGFPEAYLDIETTGLYAYQDRITVIGIYCCNECDGQVIQLFDENLTTKNLLKALEGTERLYTYNGERFDLPFIRTHLGPDLSLMHEHVDLMFDCWKNNLRGGLKVVLRRLGIARETEGLTGIDAVLLWDQYKYNNNLEALDLLLRYNRDDIVNLKELRNHLVNLKSISPLQ
ncbi:MAG: ribonuclease H-like domain-containing protein [Dehalococcoidia bacterium]|nr:ribonuclease H-like domain-containing protein [Dehalococcoidia bacterium]MDD5494291.1 ribonuclease H-like domain-containing protein [Dehalococcoidia bacterium]